MIQEKTAYVKNRISQSKWLFASGGASLFWYLSLFPGRLGSDPVQSINLMRLGESTDWWTSIYFWFLRLTTFNGNTIWLASLISMLIMYVSIIYFLFSLPENKKRIERIAFATCLSPLFGNFAVNINHDIFLVSGTLLLVGLSLRHYFSPPAKVDKYVPFAAIILLMNGKTGYFIIISFLLFQVLSCRNYLKLIGFAGAAVAIFLFTSIGITKTPVPMHFLPALADLKCVAQHPQARISTDEWKYLISLSSEESWKDAKTCASMDIALGEIRSQRLESIKTVEFVKKYLSITTKNPAIVIQAHLQRSSIALPPPFFQGPENQVDRNINNPVGFKTNTALQLGPVVLHPSIDDDSLKIQNPILKTLESVALFSSFLINQASWFWGWGGLWLWPIFIYLIFILGERKLNRIAGITYPIIATHILLIMVGPIPAPRYVMATILIGYVISLFIVSHLISTPKRIGLKK